MDAALEQVRDVFEGQIDFEGQRLAEAISTILLSIISVIALIIGFVKQDIYLTMWIGLGGVVLTMLVVVPPWPFFNKHPQSWLGSRPSLPSGGIIVAGEKIQ